MAYVCKACKAGSITAMSSKELVHYEILYHFDMRSAGTLAVNSSLMAWWADA